MNETSSGPSGRGALAEFKDALTDLFEQVVGFVPLGLGREFPRHELIVEDEGYRVQVELPGLERDEVDVSVAGRTLSVAGERRRFDPPEGGRMLRRERPSGKFELTIQLPAEVDPLAVLAHMQEGVLEVRLPKPSKPRGRSIKVKAKRPASRRKGKKREQEPAEGESP